MSDTITITQEGVATEVSTQFIKGMISRMAVSYHKYGKVKDGYEDGTVKALSLDPEVEGSLDRYLQKYRDTGNTEFLMDVANFAMIEFMYPQHPDAHYRPTDSKESPGRVRHDGRQTGSTHNLDIPSGSLS